MAQEELVLILAPKLIMEVEQPLLKFGEAQIKIVSQLEVGFDLNKHISYLLVTKKASLLF